jgi:hypothetical protein
VIEDQRVPSPWPHAFTATAASGMSTITLM